VPEYVLPNEDIEVKVSHLANKISYPAMTDLKLDFASNRIYQIYPNKFPDLFYGSEIIIAGRYGNRGKGTAILTGKIGGRPVEYNYPVEFSDGSMADEYIAMIWANRRIGFLLQELRLHGTNEELLTEVIELSKKYGIITEYTSFLVTGDDRLKADGYWEAEAPVLSDMLKKNLESYGAEKSGRSAVKQSAKLNRQSQSNILAAPNEVEINEQKHEITNAKQVGLQAFYQSGTNWIQAELKEDSFDLEIKRYSKAYFQILEQDPSLGRYLAVGDEIRLKIGSQVVQVSDTGKDILTPDELKALFAN